MKPRVSLITFCALGAVVVVTGTASGATADPRGLDKWQVRSGPSNQVVEGMSGSSSGFIGVGETGAIITSPEGVVWTRQEPATGARLLDVVSGPTALVAVGGEAIGGRILTSPDGFQWESRLLQPNTTFYDVACSDDNRFVAVGLRGVIRWSSDNGVSWHPANPTINRDFLGLAYGQGKFVAVGTGGLIVVSTNGIDWEVAIPPTNNVALASVAYGSGQFVAVGEPRFVVTSPDGVHWTHQAGLSVNDPPLWEVIYANGLFVSGGWTGVLLSSEDGVHWTTHSFPALMVKGLAFDGETVVASCVSGTDRYLVQSDSLFPSPPRIALPPRDTLVRIGGTTNLSVTALGTSPFTYQWRRNGLPLQGATNQILVFSNAPVSIEDHYDVVVESLAGTNTSSPALLRVGVPPSVALQPLDQEVVAGGTATFGVEVSGTGPLSYRWRQPGSVFTTLISTGRQSFWTVANVQAADAGIYGAIITNEVGAASTRGAQLTVVSDADGDGLPDGWEVEHGFDLNNPADAGVDSDGDGLTNIEEYVGGSDPASAGSALGLQAVSVNGLVSLEFFAEANRTYTIERSETMEPGSWSRLVDFPARSSSRIETVSDPVGSSHLFYRVVTPRQP